MTALCRAILFVLLFLFGGVAPGYAQPEVPKQVAYGAPFAPQNGDTLHFDDFDMDYRGRETTPAGASRKKVAERDYFRILTKDRSFLSKFDLLRLPGASKPFTVQGKAYLLRYQKQGKELLPVVTPDGIANR